MKSMKDKADETILSEKDIEEMRKAAAKIKVLKEDKKSLEEDIRDIKVTLSKKVGLAVKDINNIYKVYESREKGDLDDETMKIVRCLEGTLSADEIGVVHMGTDDDCFGADDNTPESESSE